MLMSWDPIRVVTWAEHPGPVLDRHGEVDVAPGLLDEETARVW